jgi:hypothetical protein
MGTGNASKSDSVDTLGSVSLLTHFVLALTLPLLPRIPLDMGMTPFRVQAQGNAIMYQRRAAEWSRKAMEGKGDVRTYQILAAQSAASARRTMGVDEVEIGVYIPSLALPFARRYGS